MNGRPLVTPAAGAVVWRKDGKRVDVLLVHRPRYDDWSFPKGKIDKGEHLLTAAAREVAEETGLTVQLGPPLPRQTYEYGRGRKHVYYWCARQICDGDAADYVANSEIDKVSWLPVSEALEQLTYPRDQELLDAFSTAAYRSHPLVIIRHARARKRRSWSGPDSERPLTPGGQAQAVSLVPMLSAYGVQRVLTSDAERCAATVSPYAEQTGADCRRVHWLSEEDFDAAKIGRKMQKLLDGKYPAAVCSHRPVFPELFRVLGMDDPKLRPGEFVVAHRRKGVVETVERHRA